MAMSEKRWLFIKSSQNHFSPQSAHSFTLCRGTVLLLGSSTGLTGLVTWRTKELHWSKKCLQGQQLGNETLIQAQREKQENTREPGATSQVVEDNCLRGSSWTAENVRSFTPAQYSLIFHEGAEISNYPTFATLQTIRDSCHGSADTW